MSHWYLIHTKIRQECVVLGHLERQGFECFLPLIRAEKVCQGALQVLQEPLFPRCLFIRPRSGQDLQNRETIRFTPGVNRLVSSGRVPTAIDDTLVQDLRARSKVSGAVLHHFEHGEQVVVSERPLEGVKAIYQMADADGRVMLLLEILSQQAKPTVQPASMRKVS